MKKYLKIFLLIIFAVTCFYAGTAFKQGKVKSQEQATTTPQEEPRKEREIINGKVKKIFEQKYILEEIGTTSEITVLINSNTKFFDEKNVQNDQNYIKKGYLVEAKGIYEGEEFQADEIRLVSTVGFLEYRNDAMNIAFSYPADWKPSGYSDEIGGRQIWYAGGNDFFELSALASNGSSLDNIALKESAKKFYGKNPQMSDITIDGQSGKTIVAVEPKYYNATVILKYPYPLELKFEGKKKTDYGYFVLYSNINYLDLLISSLKFINKEVPKEAGKEITIISPKSGDTVISPLNIDGEATGSWYFEGVFPAALYDGNGKKIASGQAEAIGEWMSEKAVPFNLKLEFSAPSTASGKLVFTNDNPSGLKENEKKFELPVKFEPAKTVSKKEEPAPKDPTITNPKAPCYVGGCSGQICSDKKVVSTCEFQDQYSCLKYAICERQPDKKCGWTITKQYNECLNKAKATSSP